MDYKKVYDQLIVRGQGRTLDCYSEWHHILPRSLGGSDDDINLVELTYREHFLAHWLLTKIYKEGRGRRAMLHAFMMMGTMGTGDRVIAGWQYEITKRVCSDGWGEERIKRHQNIVRARGNKVLCVKVAAVEERERIITELQRADLDKKYRDVLLEQYERAERIAGNFNGSVRVNGRHYHWGNHRSGRKHNNPPSWLKQ